MIKSLCVKCNQQSNCFGGGKTGKKTLNIACTWCIAPAQAMKVMMSPLLDRKNQIQGILHLYFVASPTYGCLEDNRVCPCLALCLSCSALHLISALCPCRKRLEQQQKMLEEDRKRRQFEEQKQKLRLLSSVKPKVGLSPQPVYFVCF